MEIYRKIGLRIRALRRAKGLTQADVAECAGISNSFYGHIERGTRRLSLETLARLAEALHVPIGELTLRAVDQEEPAVCEDWLRVRELLEELIALVDGKR